MAKKKWFYDKILQYNKNQEATRRPKNHSSSWKIKYGTKLSFHDF
jgi:hypothetical protein